MTDHLPECEGFRERFMPCICPELRTREQRVEQFWRAESDARVQQQIDVTRTATLQAAREAVERAYEKDSPTVQYGTVPGVALALAAIDKLKEA